MSEQVVIKFGGTSNATAETVQQCADLGRDSQILVTSAPGRLSDEQLAGFSPESDIQAEFLTEKVTDQSLAARAAYLNVGEIPRYMLDGVTERYREIVTGLGITSLQTEWLRNIAPRLETAAKFGEDYASMIGERFQAEIYQAMGWRLLDPARSPVALSADQPDSWKAWLQPLVTERQSHILPGNTYYDGERLRTFSRDGSTLSGALAAYAIAAEVYRNMTDTPAQSIPPKLMPSASRRRIIEHLTYQEGRELHRNGSGILHPAAIVPLMRAGIPTELRNTFDPDGPFTLYNNTVDPERIGRVMAISMREIAAIKVHEPGMAGKHGRLAAFDNRLRDAGISIDSESLGGDRQLFIVNSPDGGAAETAVRQATASHDGEVASRNCALIALVGYGLNTRALDIRLALHQNTAFGEHDRSGNSYWLEGIHSLRFTVPRTAAPDIIDKAHAALIE